MNKEFLILVAIISSFNSFSQLSPKPVSNINLDSIRHVILNLDTKVNNIELSLEESKNTLKTGVFIATLGYTVTIVGGQLLGTNPELGEALLYTGGAIGIGGTIVLVNGFNKLDLRLKKE